MKDRRTLAADSHRPPVLRVRIKSVGLALRSSLLAFTAGSLCADPIADKLSAGTERGSESQRVRMGPDFPSPDSYYPPRARLAGQEGTAVVHACVDPTGKLTEPPTLATSSEHASLDAAALDLAEAGSGLYLAATEHGVAVRGCALIDVAFKLPQQTKVVPPSLGPDFPSADAYYPIEAKAAAHEGAPMIHYCVDQTGKLTAPPTIATSSGNQALDAAAVSLATAGSGHYLPASENGVAVSGCGRFKIAFITHAQ